ncbi:vacuolar protein sorting-associated protein 18, putative [Plasmodium malariae]|uniref:Vacuolar protein sorting-associated protein 18, putative n=1 Tax=Plasmodium malariae TaxID=5858 RepID=A0A1A8WBD4_PLAMA|nr:vacuolar protein sorting-associated protein 18, putative [Plasmodium malariae]
MNKSDKKFILKLFKIKNGNINLLKNRITHFTINNKCIHIVLCNNALIKYYVEDNELSYIDFYNKKTTNNKAEIRSMFFDNNCYHGFICLANKEYIYVHFENNIVRNLGKLKKYNITSVCFNDYTEIKNSFPFLIATKDGEILEMSINNKTKNNKDHETIFSNDKLSILDINMVNVKLSNTNDDEMLRIIYFSTSNSLHEISYTYKNSKTNSSEKSETNMGEVKIKTNNLFANNNSNSLEDTKVYECGMDSLTSILKIENIRNKNYLFWLNGCCIFISKINNYKKKKNAKGGNTRNANKHMKNKHLTNFDDIDFLSNSSESNNSDKGINIISISEDEEMRKQEKQREKDKNKKIIQRKRLYKNNHHYNRDSEPDEENSSNKNINRNNCLFNIEFYLDSNYVIVNFLDLNIFTSENINNFSFTKAFYESIYNKADKITYHSEEENMQDREKEAKQKMNKSKIYENTVSSIIDMCVNDLYIFLLLEEKFLIINNINFKIVYEQTLAIETYGDVIRVMKDNFDNKVWLCTSKYIFNIHINKNKNDLIDLNLKKKNFAKMLEHSTKNERIRIKKHLLKNNKYEIDQYKYTNINTEEMLISFLHKKQYFLISSYLYKNIHCYNNIVRIAFFIWLIQIYSYSIDLYSYLYRATSYYYAYGATKESITQGNRVNEKKISNSSDDSDDSSEKMDEFTDKSDECSDQFSGCSDESEEYSLESQECVDKRHDTIQLPSDDMEKLNKAVEEKSPTRNGMSNIVEDRKLRNHNILNRGRGKKGEEIVGEKKDFHINVEQSLTDLSNDKNIHVKRSRDTSTNYGNNCRSSEFIANNNRNEEMDYNTEGGSCTIINNNYKKEVHICKESNKYLKSNKNSFLLFFERLISKEEKKECRYNFDFSKGKKMNIKTITDSDNFYILLKMYKMKNEEIFNFLKTQKRLIITKLEKFKKVYIDVERSDKRENLDYSKNGEMHKISEIYETGDMRDKRVVLENEYVRVKKKLYRNIYSYKCLEVCVYIIILLKHFKHFFQLNEVILEIFQGFNRLNFLLLYKFICNDYNYIINYYINNNKYNLLFNVIILFPQNVLLDVLREHAFILFLHKPQKYVDMLLFYDNLIDDYMNIIICMFITIYFFKNRKKKKEEKASTKGNKSSDATYEKHADECIRFLEYISNILIEENSLEKKENYMYTFECTWKNNHIINCLLILYIEKEENEKIKKFLNRLKSSAVHFDYLFIIRFLKERQKENFIPHIYILMKYFEEAVDKSLELGDYKTAKNAVILCEDEEEKKKLFLKIIKHISGNLNDKNLKEIINLVRDSNSILNLHDILPYINENTIIEYLKKDICSLLEVYNLKIKAKKQEIKENLQTIDLLNKDIKNVKKKHVILDKNEICYICKKTVHYKKFYVFSCQHYFHSICSLNIYINSKSKEELFQFFSVLHNYKNSLINKNEKDTLIYETKIDEILTEECFICGSFSINSITQSFISQNESDLVESWMISKE